MGMWRTGIFDEIIGIDIEPQPDYPFVFIQADALNLGDIEDPLLTAADFIWASPPCQSFSSIGKWRQLDYKARAHVDLIAPTRDLLTDINAFWCIENVPLAPLRPDIILEGGNVGIPNMKRRRLFEVSWETGLHQKPYTDGGVLWQIYGHGGPVDPRSRVVGRRESLGLSKRWTAAEVQELWDVGWCSDRKALTQMVPPAYATYIVEDAIKHGLGGSTCST